ncbi:MAG: hypothetical protein E7039_04180 [Lentisphaerae bacterium]|nr:hypothetical protein [Lentisphaerota bacterium]
MRIKPLLLTAIFLSLIHCHASDNGEKPLVLIGAKNNTPQSYRIYKENGAVLTIKSQNGMLSAHAELKAADPAKRVEARLSVKRELIAQLVNSAIAGKQDICGIDFEFDAPAESAGKKVLVLLNLGNNTLLDRHIVLESGRHRYRFTPKLAAKPFNWNSLKNVLIYFRENTARSFSTGEIRLFAKPAAPGRKLQLTAMPQTVEILPGGTVFDTFYKRPELRQETGNIQKIKVSFDRKNLYIHSQAKFSKKPLANEKRHDDRVYQDDSLEIFFSSLLDNSTYDHFCINALGTVRDERHGFDPVAVMVRNQLEHDFKFSKKISFKDGVLDINLTFPMEEFLLTPGKSTFTLMQLAQQIDGVSRVLGISSMNRNFDIASFTPVVFNHNAFGNGRIAIEQIEFAGNGGSAKAAVKLKINGVKPGQYRLSFIFSTPDKRKVEINYGKIKITRPEEIINPTVLNVPDVDGIYRVFAILKNARNDLLVSSTQAVNQRPVAYRFGAGDFQPQVKKFIPAKGVFNAGKVKNISIAANATLRTEKSANILRKYLADFAGASAAVKRGGNADIQLQVDPELKVKAQGYKLTVTPQKVIITGKDEPGLYYGIQTFVQMIKMPMKRTLNSPVRCCEITDYPDLERRIAYLWHPRSVPGGAEVAEGTDVKYICSFIERFAAANKLNTLMLRIDKSLMFESHDRFKKFKHKRYLTMKDVRAISRFCEDHFIEIMPKFPGGSHDALIDIFPEFREGDWKATANVKHPEYMKTYLACVQELLDATGCKMFTPGSDEWYFKKRKPGVTPPEDAKRYSQNFLDFHFTLHKFLKERNVRMVICHDMLIPDKNGRNFDIYRNADKLPEDIAVMVWSISPNEKTLKQKGFELWFVGTGEDIPYGTAKLYSGYGSSLYLFGTELAWRFPGAYKRLYKWFISGDVGWNIFTRNDLDAPHGLASGRLAGVQSLFAESANPAASCETIPLVLPEKYLKNIDRELHRLLPENYPAATGNLVMEKHSQYGNIKMNPTADALLTAPGMKAINIPVNSKCSSLIFLHSAFETASYRKSRKPVPGNSVKNVWHRGYPIGNYKVIYSDNSIAEIPIRLGAQIDWFQVQPASGTATDTRYMHIMYDQQKRPVFLYQYEWVNPHPEKIVKSLVIAHDNPLKFKALTFAISKRNVKNEE